MHKSWVLKRGKSWTIMVAARQGAQTKQERSAGTMKTNDLETTASGRGAEAGAAVDAAQLINVLYGIVDRIFISAIPQVGELALAGIGCCGPIVTLITSFAVLVGLGGAPLWRCAWRRKPGRRARHFGQLHRPAGCALGGADRRRVLASCAAFARFWRRRRADGPMPSRICAILRWGLFSASARPG
jgi:hypothetical protein